MSDYLWDKTGEPEDDVARLENLLGTLKYQPRPLEIPSDATPARTATRTRPTAAAIFSRPRLALAASLILTLLAGAWLITRQDEPQKNRLAEVKQETPAHMINRTETAADTRAGLNGNAPADNAAPAKPRGDKAVAMTAAVSLPKVHRATRQSAAKRRKLQPRAEDDGIAPREEVAAEGALRWQAEQPLTQQQREATEQLMLALRLASAKLNYAQREMQEIGRAGK